MCNTIKELMNGNEKIIEYYSNATKIWKDIDNTDENLSKELLNRQYEFELLYGGRSLGQEIMVCSGVFQYICVDTSNTQSAKKVVNAFINSSCSIEVKQFARDVKQYFNL